LREGGFPADKIPWDSELVARVQRLVSHVETRLHGYELYWIAKVLPEPWLKTQVLKNFASEGRFRFWSARTLVDVWGGDDPEVRQAFLQFLDQGVDDAALVAEIFPAVGEDKHACRSAFLRALDSKSRDIASIVRGFRKLGVSPNDDEAFEACLNAAAHLDAPLYLDQWRAEMILTFSDRPAILVGIAPP
jgi:hypothetical protein